MIFAPDHAAVTGELGRVTKPGGRIGLTVWRGESGVGDMFRAMSAFQPPPPPGAGSPFQWGSEEYAESLLGDDFELEFVELDSPQLGESGEQVWRLFVDYDGPSRTLADSLDAERRAELDRTMADFFEQFREGDGIHQPRPYIVVLGTRR